MILILPFIHIYPKLFHTCFCQASSPNAWLQQVDSNPVCFSLGWYSASAIRHLPSLPDELARVCACKWDSDENKVVLEISEPDKKKTTDAQVCTWRDLFKDLEDEGHTDVTINSHDMQRVSMAEGSDDKRAWSLISCWYHVGNKFPYNWYFGWSMLTFFFEYRWVLNEEPAASRWILFEAEAQWDVLCLGHDVHQWSQIHCHGIHFYQWCSLAEAWGKCCKNHGNQDFCLWQPSKNWKTCHIPKCIIERPSKRADHWNACGGSSIPRNPKKLVSIKWFVQTCPPASCLCGRHDTSSLELCSCSLRRYPRATGMHSNDLGGTVTVWSMQCFHLISEKMTHNFTSREAAVLHEEKHQHGREWSDPTCVKHWLYLQKWLADLAGEILSDDLTKRNWNSMRTPQIEIKKCSGCVASQAWLIKAPTCLFQIPWNISW